MNTCSTCEKFMRLFCKRHETAKHTPHHLWKCKEVISTNQGTSFTFRSYLHDYFTVTRGNITPGSVLYKLEKYNRSHRAADNLAVISVFMSCVALNYRRVPLFMSLCREVTLLNTNSQQVEGGKKQKNNYHKNLVHITGLDV